MIWGEGKIQAIKYIFFQKISGGLVKLAGHRGFLHWQADFRSPAKPHGLGVPNSISHASILVYRLSEFPTDSLSLLTPQNSDVRETEIWRWKYNGRSREDFL